MTESHRRDREWREDTVCPLQQNETGFSKLNKNTTLFFFYYIPKCGKAAGLYQPSFVDLWGVLVLSH